MSEQKSLALYIRSGAVQGSIEDTLKERAGDFTTSLLTVINGNPLLAECDPQEVVRTALKAASMRLPIDPNLGLAYIIPFNNNKKIRETFKDSKGVTCTRDVWVKKMEPQLQIGWKGFIQLALRTRLYKTINVTDVHEGEYVGTDRLTGEIEFNWEADNAARAKKPVTGYVGYFRLHDGFEKILYMTVEELEGHARQYSKSYANGQGKWKDDKPNMSKKTVIKLLISKWGPQSTEIQRALRADQASMGDDDQYKYVDNDKSETPPAEPPQESPADEPQEHPTEGVIEGEVVDAPAEPATTGDANQTETEAVTPALTIKEKAAKWRAEHKNEPSQKGGKPDDDAVQGTASQADAPTDKAA